jgi:hypothetical protein
MIEQDSDSNLFSSKQMKAILRIHDCELMQRREAGNISFVKKGNAYLYRLPAGQSVLNHSLGADLLNWHKQKHQSTISNVPQSTESKIALEKLIVDILLPLDSKFKRPTITYGFTSYELKKYITRRSPKGTSAELDQHSAFELNDKGTMICSRGGAACDYYINGYSMTTVVKYIVNNLPFDRLYFYGDTRPIHVSINSEPMRHLQIMHESAEGRRYPSKKAMGEEDPIRLLGEL